MRTRIGRRCIVAAMGYSQVTGMSSTRFPLKGLSGCGCQATSGLGQVENSPLGGLLALGLFGTLAYLTFTSPGTWKIGRDVTYTSGGYYDHGLGKWVTPNRRRRGRGRRRR